jgi:type IV pilus assembly protein PilC
MASIDLSKYSSKTLTKKENLNQKNASAESSISKVLNTEIKIFEKKFGPIQKESFYSELSLLLSAGVDIKTAFEILEKEVKNKKHQDMIIQIKNDVISGNTIAGSMQKYSGVFTNYECQSVKIGEETAKLSEVLAELGRFYNGSIKLRRQIIGTLTYPIIVLSLAALIVYFMLSFVVPMFADIFKQTGGQLPESTQFLIALSKKTSLIFYSTVGIVLGFYFLHKYHGRKNWYRSLTSAFFLKIPVVNTLIRKIYLARFCQSMRLLLGAKVLLIDALDLVKNMIEYYPIEQALELVRKDVLAGKMLHESLSQHSIFPQKLIALIKVSEEVNAPEMIFEKLTKQYSDEIEHQQAVVGKVIEPFFIVILGLIIGFILVSLYLPLFQLSSGFQ